LGPGQGGSSFVSVGVLGGSGDAGDSGGTGGSPCSNLVSGSGSFGGGGGVVSLKLAGS